MPVNATARHYKIWVIRPNEAQVNWLDVTKYCSGESGGFYTVTSQAIDEGGICNATGSLVLDVPPFDPLFDPWENSGRWAIGNQVLVHVADSSGTLRPLPVNRLYIISEPLPPYPGNWSLTLELADYLTYIDSNPLPKAATPKGLALPKSRKALVGDMIEGAEVGGEMPGGELSGYEAEPGLPAVRAAGELAIGGFSALYQDASGSMKTARIVFTPAPRLFKHVVGVDDAGDYEPLQNPLRPSGEIEVVSEASAAAPEDGGVGGERGGDDDEDGEKQKYRGRVKTEEVLSRAAIAEDGDSSEQVAIRRIEEWAWEGDQYKQSIEESRARGLVVPEDLFEFFLSQGRALSYLSPYQVLSGAFTQSETKKFEGGDEGRLLRFERIATRMQGECFAELYKKIVAPNQPRPNIYFPIVAEREVTTYSYQTHSGKDSKGQVRKIKTVRWAPLGQVAGGANDWLRPGLVGTFLAANPADPCVAYVKVETWQKRSKDEWAYRVQEYQAGRARGGTIKAFRRLVRIKGDTVNSRNGEIRPPAAERRPGKEGGQKRRNSYLTQIIRGSSRFGDGARKRQVRINHLKDAAHAKKLAELIGKLEHYRHRGFRITTVLRDEWFSWKPLSRVDLEYNGYLYFGLTDQLTFTLSATQAIVVADCMRTGRSPLPPEQDDYPYPPLPALQPTDPDPTPFPEPDPADENPERLNTQAIIPAVQVVTPITINSRARGTFRTLLHGIENTTANFTVNSKARLLIGELLTFTSRARVLIEQVPKLTARARARVVITESTTEPGLISEWKLDTTAWVDSVGDNDLTAVGAGLELGFDGTDYYATAPYFDPELESYQSETNYLQCSGAALDTRPPEGNWSWRLVFDLWIGSETGAILRLNNQFLIERDFEGNGFTVYADTEFGSANIGGASLTPNQWHSVEFRYDAAANESKTYRNGVLVSTLDLESSFEGVPQYRPVGTFDVLPSVYGTRLKNVKFYKTALLPRS